LYHRACLAKLAAMGRTNKYALTVIVSDSGALVGASYLHSSKSIGGVTCGDPYQYHASLYDRIADVGKLRI
jgi:hypothetical protein